ncbi:DUF1266 domain-containing protein [Agathobacter sp.]
MLVIVLFVLFVIGAFSDFLFLCYLVIAAAIGLFIGNIVYKKAYRKKITPTMHFIISCCNLTNRWSGCDEPEIGGTEKSIGNRRRMRGALRGPWGIKNRKKFNETIKWLQEAGHNKECMDDLKKLRTNPEQVSNQEALNMIAERYPQCGIIAWDMCRLCNVATWGTIAGYISYEDAIKICVQAGKNMQKYFTSWDEMIDNYLAGYLYWSGDKQQMAVRKNFFVSQKKEKKLPLYKVDFNTPLDEKDVIKQRWNLFL